ncbi:MAG: hypothetical protein ABI810_07190 [Sphingomonas bacterium]
MQDDQTTEESRFDPLLPAALMLQGLQFWQAPMILGTAWWNGMVDAFWPRPMVGHHACHHDPHHQLAVPEPIEADGERMLVA